MAAAREALVPVEAAILYRTKIALIHKLAVRGMSGSGSVQSPSAILFVGAFKSGPQDFAKNFSRLYNSENTAIKSMCGLLERPGMST